MNIAIVDDDQKEIDTLESVIREYASLGKFALTLNIFHSAEEIIEAYHPYAYTAIFMDIYMGGKTGIEAAERILSLDRHAIIIFLTTSDEHMPEAFSMHAYDYIGKPAKKERLFKVMDDVLMRVSEYDASPKLTFSCDKTSVSLPFSDIVCVMTSTQHHNYLEITDEANNTYLTRLTFAEASKTLTADQRFLLILRGVLVNMEHISLFNKGVCCLKTGAKLPVNIKKAKELENTWQNYTFDSIRNERRERRQHR